MTRVVIEVRRLRKILNVLLFQGSKKHMRKMEFYNFLKAFPIALKRLGASILIKQILGKFLMELKNIHLAHRYQFDN